MLHHMSVQEVSAKFLVVAFEGTKRPIPRKKNSEKGQVSNFLLGVVDPLEHFSYHYKWEEERGNIDPHVIPYQTGMLMAYHLGTL